jgi:hypothetical protein
MSIQQIVNETNQILHSEPPTKRVLAVGIEINQRYLEYLEWLEEQDLSTENGVTVNVDGQKIRFPDMDKFANWITENMT